MYCEKCKLDFDPERQIAIIWSIEDVQEIRPDLNDKQSMEVLEEARDHHDCEFGFTWEHLRVTADLLFPEKQSTESDI